MPNRCDDDDSVNDGEDEDGQEMVHHQGKLQTMEQKPSELEFCSLAKCKNVKCKNVNFDIDAGNDDDVAVK